MKSKIIIFSALLLGIFNAHASDCIGEGCTIEPISKKINIQKPTPLPTEFIAATDQINQRLDVLEMGSAPAPAPQQIQYVVTADSAMVPIKTLSIKKSVPDNRAPLWDGSHGTYKQKSFDKTVDWRDGVPIWDDSISNYKQKDFRDWFIEPSPMVFVGAQAAPEPDIVVMDQIEEILAPYKPANNLWTNEKYIAQDLSIAIDDAFGMDDGCPFETDVECIIWRRKPMVRETVSPRSATLRSDKMDAFLSATCANKDITANAPVAAPLLDRYQMLMKSARACCTDGMAYELKRGGATDGLVYKFLSDDANFYQIGTRCLMMTDKELDTKYPNTAAATVAADVRNGCLCRGRQWFTAMLAPFREAYAADPEFAKSKFNYTYKDGLKREITTSVNTDVQNVLGQLEMCP